jgi:V/A-type H+/Na+-transporting ATPase subunit E
MPLYDQVELLCQAIASQAKAEVDQILARAREEADRRLIEAEASHQEALARTKAEVEAQAKLSARNRIDRAELEGKRRVSQTKEIWLTEVFGQAQARLQAFRDTAGYRNWLRATLLGVLQQLEGEDFRVMAHPEEEKWLYPDLLGEVSAERGCHLAWAPDPDLPPGGFVVIRADGRVRIDQTFQGIIERQRETLRAETAGKLWGS